MSTMKITEYKDMGYAGNNAQIPQEPPLAIQTITTSATTAPSAEFHADTKFVSVQLSADGYIQFAEVPVATATTSRTHKANAVSFHGVPQGFKIAGIDA